VSETIRKDTSRYVLYQEDITNTAAMERIMRTEKVSSIFHLAAESSVDVSFQQSLQFTRTNVLGTHTLLQIVSQLRANEKAHPFRLFIHVSTDEVLGSSYEDAATEDQDSDPTNPYSASKAAAEVYVRTYSRYLNVPCAIVRLNNVVGERQFLDKLIPKCVVRRLLGLPMLVHGGGLSRRHFLDARDVARALHLILEKGRTNETYHVAESDTDHSVLDIVHWIATHVKPNKEWQNYWQMDAERLDDPKSEASVNTPAWVYVANRTFQDHRYQLDGKKLQAMGFQCQYSFEDSLRRTAAWYENELLHISHMVHHNRNILLQWLHGHYTSTQP
jgi:dTDP-glucose 4,6-dehydratase